jgi:hypothetical protein
MGIDAQTFSKALPMGKFWRMKGEKALRQIESHARTWATKNELGPFFSCTPPTESSIWVSILPIADPIQFTVSDTDVSVSFRSSNGGPGYHAAVIELLDDLAITLKMSWNWRNSDGECTDETEFALNRDFAQLQAKMADFLKFLMRWVAQEGPRSGPICLPLGLGVDSEGYSCPLGPKDEFWPRTVCEADSEELLLEASAFFPWWDRQRNSDFWKAMLLGSLWQNAVWRKPVSRYEQGVIEAVEHAVSRLKALSAQLDTSLGSALLEFRNSVESDNAPPEAGIGYRRGRVCHYIFRKWSVSLPGWLIEDSPSDDGSVALFYDNARSLRISSYSIDQAAESLAQLSSHPREWLPAMAGAKDREVDGFLWRKSPPEHDADEGSYAQTAFVAKLKLGGNQFLLVTLAADSIEKLVVFDDWLAGISYREDSLEDQEGSSHSALLH